jgi:hypothetical protein
MSAFNHKASWAWLGLWERAGPGTAARDARLSLEIEVLIP